MKSLNLRKSLAVVAVGLACSTSAWANFIVDQNPGGEKFFLDNSKGSTAFSGSVGSEVINGLANVNVQTGSGYANIKADDKDDILTTLTFTPVNSSAFNGFSFRGQLNENGSVWVTVWDQLGNPSQTFEFPNLGDNKGNFERIGIISTDNQTIMKVEVSSANIFELKQIDWNPTNQVPDGGLTAMLLGLGLAGLSLGRRMIQK